MTPDDVVRASNAWVYVPDEATVVETPDYCLVRFPDHFVNPLELVRFTPTRPAAEVVPEVVEQARSFGLPEVVWRVRLDSPSDAEPLLRDLGSTIDETLDVFALDLTRPLPGLDRPDVELRWATEPATTRDALVIGTEVFGGGLPSDADVQRSAARDAVGLPAGRGGRLVAYLDDTAVGTGALSSRGPAAGLWGGAVLEQSRGRGIYRALLAARLEYAAAHHMTMALVKGRVQTSGPVLRRAGFGGYGQERSYRLPLG